MLGATISLSWVAVTAVAHEPRLEQNPELPGDVAVFYPEHPDDEVLWGGSAIRVALDTKGADNVYVVLVSEGVGATPYIKPPGFNRLTLAQRGALRIDEFRAAMDALGVEAENIIVLPDGTRAPDDNFTEMRQTALDLQHKAEREGKTVTHVAHSYAFDSNPLHRANGEVIKSLLDEGLITDALFWIKPQYKYQVPAGTMLRFQSLTPTDSAAVRSAIRAYTETDADSSLEAIGYRSTPWYFAMLTWDSNLTSLLHTAAVPE